MGTLVRRFVKGNPDAVGQGEREEEGDDAGERGQGQRPCADAPEPDRPL